MSAHINTKVAFDLVRRAADLFHLGTGIAIEPMEGLEPQGVGFIDDIDIDSQLYRYANDLLHFVRTVHGILQNSLLEGEEV